MTTPVPSSNVDEGYTIKWNLYSWSIQQEPYSMLLKHRKISLKTKFKEAELINFLLQNSVVIILTFRQHIYNPITPHNDT
jgi:hypothetical protein